MFQKKRKIISDFVLNIISNLLPIVIIQLIAFPYFAKKYDDVEYGFIVTFTSMISLIPMSFGDVLNNIRLLRNETYKEEKLEGDFNVILILFAIFNSTIMAILIKIYRGCDLPELIVLVIISLFYLVKNYFEVGFRIELNYKKVLYENVFLSFGFLLGLVVLKKFDHWYFVYFIGLFACLSYIVNNVGIWRDKIIITNKFKYTLAECIILLISAMLGRVLTFADKMVIFPALGGTQVSIYNTATVIGKMIPMVTSPITGVALGYLAKKNNNSKRLFLTVFIMAIIIGGLGYTCCIILSRPVLLYLYPKYADEALQYVYLTTLIVFFEVLVSVVNIFLLRYLLIKWQVIINAAMCLLYFVNMFFALRVKSLKAFCIAVLLTQVVKLIMMIIIYTNYSSVEN